MASTKEICGALRTALDGILPELEKQLGVHITVGTMHYTADTITFTTKCVTVDDGVDVSDKRAVEEMFFRRYAKSRGGDPEWLHRKAYIKENVYTVVGLDINAKKHAFLIQREKDGTFHLSDALTIRHGIQEHGCYAYREKENSSQKGKA